MYAVRFVDETDLPTGHDWLMVRHGNDYLAVFDRECVRPWMLEEAWEAYRRIADRFLVSA